MEKDSLLYNAILELTDFWWFTDQKVVEKKEKKMITQLAQDSPFFTFVDSWLFHSSDSFTENLHTRQLSLVSTM